MTDTAIVGAGVAAAGVAYALDEPAVAFEQARTVGGRTATRRRDGCRYDHGANYVKPDDDRVARLLTGELPTDGLVDIAEPVWTFDASGAVAEGRGADDHKWTYREGIDQLAERLFAASAARVETGTRIEGLAREGGRWRLRDADGADLGAFDRVVLTPPAPRTADLLAAADWDHPARDEVADAAGAVPYRTIRSVVLHYPFEFDRPYYALVNADKSHDVGWVGREACKPGHVPDGEALLVVQMSPEWSIERDGAEGDLAAEVADTVADLLGDDRLREPDWVDDRRWRHALPDAGADDAVTEAEDHGLFVAGDWVAGEARAHAALRSGLDLGDRLAE